MLKSVKTLWPLASRTVKTFHKPKVILPRISSQHIIQPMQIYRTFATFGEVAPMEVVPEEVTLEELIHDPTNIQLEYSSAGESWANYLECIDKGTKIAAQDFSDIIISTRRDIEINELEKIKRLQLILRHIDSRLKSQPKLKESFIYACNNLMSIHIFRGNIKYAMMVFDGLAISDCKPNNISMRTIFSGINQLGTTSDLHKFIKSLEQRELCNNTDVYKMALTAFKNFVDLHGCQYYFNKIAKVGLDQDEECYKIMMAAYRQDKKREAVLELYESMKKKDMNIEAAIYGIVLSVLSSNKQSKGTVEDILKEMRTSRVNLNSTHYMAMKWDPLDAIQDMKESNVSIVSRDYNRFLIHYMKRNKFEEAFEIYKMMSENDFNMDVFGYGIVMDLFVKDLKQSPESVFEMYEKMKSRGIKPDCAIYTPLLSACNRIQDLDRAMGLLEEMTAYGVKPNEITFNSIFSILSTMAGALQTDLVRARLIWRRMISLRIRPSTRTYNIYFSIICKLIKPAEHASIEQTRSLWGEEENDLHVPETVREMLIMYKDMRRKRDPAIQPDFLTYTIVINSLSAAGQLRSAMEVYSEAKMSFVTLPVSVYNVIMRTLQMNGKMSEAMNVWYDMKIGGVLPDSASYEIVLEACKQLGLSDALTNICNQRKSDLYRLLELDTKKEQRMQNAYK